MKAVNPAPQRRGLLPAIAGLALAALFSIAGFWQLARGQYKDTLAQRHAALQLAALPVHPDHDADGIRVAAKGRWLADRTIWIDNRTHEGRAGVHFLTPLLLADGRWLYVNRGWAPLPDRRQMPRQPALAHGEVAIEGRLQMPAEGFRLGTAPAGGRLWPRIDPESMRALAAGAAVYPAVLQLEQGQGDGLVRDWAPPPMSGDRHRAYAAQWFSFAAIALGLAVWAVRKRFKHES